MGDARTSNEIMLRDTRSAWQLRTGFDLPDAVFGQEATRLGLRHLRRESFPVADSPPPLRDLGTEVVTRRYHRGEDTVLRLGDEAVALVELRAGSAQIEVAATERSAADAHCETLARKLGALQESDDEVAVTFWAQAQNGARSARRRVAAPNWSEIHANYAPQTGLGVAHLITARVPESGRLILWHGEPGTGKTHALRALSRACDDWCSTHYVTDPESFLGAGTSYLLDVLTADDRAGGPPRWKLVVLEDAGELLSVDAHERTGQALSRLLNVTDGVLGQGMKTIILVTTNEPLGRLHPAITRPGRCWAQIEFTALPAADANRWLASHDSAARVTEPTALADLYAILRGREPKAVRPFGFRAVG